MKKISISSFLIALFYLHGSLIGQITAKFSADNAYAIYVGNNNSVTQKVIPSNPSVNGVANTTTQKIFNATVQKNISCKANGYFYVIAWADNGGCQGLIGEFTGDLTLKTGEPGWEVFATGINYAPTSGPTSAIINSQIAIANSTGWSTPHIGPRNDQTNTVCSPYSGVSKVNGISDDAHWVWNNKGTHSHSDAPFAAYNHDEFLIFRFPCSAIFNVEGNSTSNFETCCPPLDKETIANLFVPTFKGNNSYQMIFKPSKLALIKFNNSMQAYVNLLKYTCGAKSLNFTWQLCEMGTGNQPNSGYCNTVIEQEFAHFNANGVGNMTSNNSGFFNNIGSVCQANTWYRITVGIYPNDKLDCFKKSCSDNLIIDFRWQSLNGSKTNGKLQMLGMSGKRIINGGSR